MEHDWPVGSYEKTKILLVHGANPNKQCATGYVRWRVAENHCLHYVLLQGYGIESRCSSTEVSHRWFTSSISCQSEHFQSIGQNSASPSGCFLRGWKCESDTSSVSSKSTQTAAKRGCHCRDLDMPNVTEGYSITFQSFKAGADPTIEDRNQRQPLDEAVIANKPGLSYLRFRGQTCLSLL